MSSKTLCPTLFLMVAFAASAFAQQNDSCATLINVKAPSLEITKAAHVEAGSTEPIPWNQSRSAPLPAYCRVEGVIHRRTGVRGEEFGINFALAMPEKWNGDFLMPRLRRQQWYCPGAAWVECRGRQAWTDSRIRSCEYGYRS